MKEGLGIVNSYFMSLPESERERGISAIAPRAPDGNIVAEIRARYMRDHEPIRTARSLEDERELVKKLKAFGEQPTLNSAELNSPRKETMISIKSNIHKKRGSWWQVPKNLPNNTGKDED